MKTVEIKVEQGILRGEETDTKRVFKGVPYAKPPVGNLRFSSPQPPDRWLGVKEALSFSKICPQPKATNPFYRKEFYAYPDYPYPDMSEDCLYLNIWAPSHTKGGCPVAVWIHGGAFDHGYGNEVTFDGDVFVQNGVILVTLNYRVGIFGFFAHPELTEADPTHCVSNYGILDQIMALRWIRRNIEAFGGDPDNITLFGQSAGAMSVQTLISSPMTRGMVAKAIIQSGVGYQNPILKDKTIEEAYQTGEEIMKLAGVKNIQALRQVPASKLVDILPKLQKSSQHILFSPVVDGFVLEDSLDSLAKRGDIQDIPCIIGVNGNDFGFGKEESIRKSAYFQSMIDFVNLHNQHGKSSSYLYIFDRQLPGDDAGAFHSAELWYVFGTLNRCWRPMEVRDYKISDEMISAWTSFMKDGNPGLGWKPFHEENDFIRRF
ncbi:MAG: carboxylesterase family protein [Erysipelotrichaceae bacterium]|nr:carboxylesterase family protein [Erysipelotrichaceae bacterium]